MTPITVETADFVRSLGREADRTGPSAGRHDRPERDVQPSERWSVRAMDATVHRWADERTWCPDETTDRREPTAEM